MWVRACGQRLGVVMKDYPDIMLKIAREHYMYEDSDCDCDDYDGEGCDCGPRCRRPPDASEQWLAACPTLAWANMHVAATNRPSLTMLLGPE